MESDFSRNVYTDGTLEYRALAYLDNIIGSQRETAFGFVLEVRVDPETEGLGYLRGRSDCLGINDPAGNVHLDGRSGIGQTSGLKNQIFNLHVVCIFVGSREYHLAVDG